MSVSSGMVRAGGVGLLLRVSFVSCWVRLSIAGGAMGLAACDLVELTSHGRARCSRAAFREERRVEVVEALDEVEVVRIEGVGRERMAAEWVEVGMREGRGPADALRPTGLARTSFSRTRRGISDEVVEMVVVSIVRICMM